MGDINRSTTSIQHLDQTSDVPGSDDDDDYKAGDPIDDITLTKRQIDSVFGVRKRGVQLSIEDFELPASIPLDVINISGAEMMALHISGGVPDPQITREAMAIPFWPQLKEATFLQQPSHLLILSLPRFALETLIPELISIVETVGVLVEAFLEIGQNRCDGLEVVRLGLPPLDILDDFRRFLSLTKVDHVVTKLVASPVVDEGQCCEVDTYRAS